MHSSYIESEYNDSSFNLPGLSKDSILKVSRIHN